MKKSSNSHGKREKGELKTHKKALKIKEKKMVVSMIWWPFIADMLLLKIWKKKKKNLEDAL